MELIEFTHNDFLITPWEAKFKRVFKKYSSFGSRAYADALRKIYWNGCDKAIAVLRRILNDGCIYFDETNEDMVRDAFVVAKICGIHINVTDRKYLRLIPQEALTLDLCFDIINLKPYSKNEEESNKKLDVCDDEFYDECKLNNIVGAHNISLYFEKLDKGEFIELVLRSKGNKKLLELVREVTLYSYSKSDTITINVAQYHDIIHSFLVNELCDSDMLKILQSIAKLDSHQAYFTEYFTKYFKHLTLLASINLNYLDSESYAIKRIIESEKLPFTFEMIKKFYCDIFSIKNIFTDFKIGLINLKRNIEMILTDFNLFIAMVIAKNTCNFELDLINFINSYGSDNSPYTIVVSYHTRYNDDTKINEKHSAIVTLRHLYKYYQFNLNKIEIKGIDFKEKEYLICNTGSLTKPAIKKTQ